MGLLKASRMTPEDLAAAFERLERPRIRSVMLYGSAAAGDHVARRSDYNVMVVADSLVPEDLRALRDITRRWVREGHPPPLLLTLQQLHGSCDVFPIEILDLRDSHRVLLGEDVAAGLAVQPENLRLQLEHELKSKLIRLREAYLLTGGKSGQVVRLVTDSLSSILVLCRATLRLFQPQVPPRKLDAVRELSRHLRLEVEVFEQAAALKEGRLTPRQVEAESLFARYLGAVEALVEQVDTLIRR